MEVMLFTSFPPPLAQLTSLHMKGLCKVAPQKSEAFQISWGNGEFLLRTPTEC